MAQGPSRGLVYMMPFFLNSDKRILSSYSPIFVDVSGGLKFTMVDKMWSNTTYTATHLVMRFGSSVNMHDSEDQQMPDST